MHHSHYSQPGSGSGSGPGQGSSSYLPSTSQITTANVRDPNPNSKARSNYQFYNNNNNSDRTQQQEIDKFYRNSAICGSSTVKVPSVWPSHQQSTYRLHLPMSLPMPPAPVSCPISVPVQVTSTNTVSGHQGQSIQPLMMSQIARPQANLRSFKVLQPSRTQNIIMYPYNPHESGFNLLSTTTPCHQPLSVLSAEDRAPGLSLQSVFVGTPGTVSTPSNLLNNNSYYSFESHICNDVCPQSPDADVMIKDVWKGNLDAEFKNIRNLLPNFKYVAMDTEFPGVVIRNAPYSRDMEGNQLETIRRNVDILKLIQLGISFFDENGIPPPGTSTWQFNFKFNKRLDLSAQPSIDLLHLAGVQFERHEEDGIDPLDFCYLLYSSGLVLQGDVSWLTYHGGYDFCYLMRMLRGENLPENPDEFSRLMEIYFPNRYDIKVILADYPGFVGGLHDVSVKLGLQRIGVPHQAGSDSLLTGKVFFRVKNVLFNNVYAGAEADKLENYNGKIFGLGLELGPAQLVGPESEELQDVIVPEDRVQDDQGDELKQLEMDLEPSGEMKIDEDGGTGTGTGTITIITGTGVNEFQDESGEDTEGETDDDVSSSSSFLSAASTSIHSDDCCCEDSNPSAIASTNEAPLLPVMTTEL